MKKQKSIANAYNKYAKKYVEQHGHNEHLSLPSLKRFLTYLPAHAQILDVGCGGGQDSKFLTEHGCFVAGIDVSREMIKLAREYTSHVTFKIADVMKLSAKTKYDGIWCSRVFQHISFTQQDKFIDKLQGLLKKDGVLYITSIVSDRKDDYEAYDSGIGKLLKKRLTEKSFKDLLIRHNLKMIKFKYWNDKKGMEIFAIH